MSQISKESFSTWSKLDGDNAKVYRKVMAAFTKNK